MPFPVHHGCALAQVQLCAPTPVALPLISIGFSYPETFRWPILFPSSFCMISLFIILTSLKILLRLLSVCIKAAIINNEMPRNDRIRIFFYDYYSYVFFQPFINRLILIINR